MPWRCRVAASRQPGNIQGIYRADESASPDRKNAVPFWKS